MIKLFLSSLIGCLVNIELNGRSCIGFFGEVELPECLKDDKR